jgi:NADPH-dependent 2,4-dienoyl-CoA reductase/sulfur reductase-like enzyme
MSDAAYVVVGGGLAGAKAVEAIRETGGQGRVVLVCAEAELPYERPPLSKEYLKGDKEPAAFRALDADWYKTHDVELIAGVRATKLNTSDRSLGLSDGSTLTYGRLLLATGAEPTPLPVPGADQAPLHYLRTLGDSSALREQLSPGGRRVVIVGAGWIGLEVAAAARGYGNEVTVIEAADTPLSRALGSEVGEFFARVHREEGVHLHTGQGVASIEHHGLTTIVIDQSGTRHEADVVVVGAGIRPSIELARESGLAVATGIVVDASLRTSDPHVWAAGDAAEAYHPYLGRHLHVEHWSFALNSGAASGRSMAGEEVTFDRVPYFFTDQYDVGMEFCGTTDSFDQVVYRGDRSGREFIAFWLSEGSVVAGMNVNVWDVTDAIQALVRSSATVDVQRLTDPDVPLTDLA